MPHNIVYKVEMLVVADEIQWLIIGKVEAESTFGDNISSVIRPSRQILKECPFPTSTSLIPEKLEYKNAMGKGPLKDNKQ